MSFFKKIGKAVGKVTKTVGKVAGGVIKTVAPVLSIVPGVGAIASGAAGLIGEVLSPTKQQSIVEAVEQQGVVKVDKIEQTIVSENPNISAGDLKATTEAMTKAALAANPTAKVDDSNAEVAKIDLMTKAIQWVKSNFLIVGAAVVGGFILLTNKNGGRRRRW